MNEFEAARRLYDRLSPFYDALAGRAESASRDAGLELLAVRAGEEVLEIGFGTGRALVQLAGATGARGQVHGVDVSPGMTEAARRALEQSLPDFLQRTVSLVTAPVPPIPYATVQFDAVFVSFTLELFPFPTIPLVLREVARVLREDGRLGLVSMATRPGGESSTLMERLYVRLHRRFPRAFDCRPIDAPALLKQSGFIITDSRRLSLWGLPVLAAVARHDPHQRT